MGTQIARKTVELFYDVVSPYTWFGFEVLCRYQNKWSMNLCFKPFFLGGIMQGSGNTAPVLVPNKGVYMQKELVWLSQHYQIPLKLPENPSESLFGRGASLPAMRFLTALNMVQPEKIEDTSRALWMRLWSRGQLISKPEYLAEAGKEAGLSEAVIRDVLEKMGSQSVKDRLKEVTEEALDHGAFGSPIMVTTDSNNKTCMLFGSDRIHILAEILGEKYEGPLLQYNKCKL